MIERIFKKDEINIDWEFVETIPEFARLLTTKQGLRYHSEGNAMIHTKMVVNEMIKITENNIAYDKCSIPNIKCNISDRQILILSALFHDIGKGTTTTYDVEHNTYHSYGHEYSSEKLTRILLWNEDFYLRESICLLVKNHMKPLLLLNTKKCNYNISNFVNNPMRVPFEWLITLKRCDSRGCIPTVQDNSEEILNNLELHYKSMKVNSKNRNIDDKNIINIYVMIGISGAGKNTYISNNLSNLPIIERDTIRNEIGIIGNNSIGSFEDEKMVTEIANSRMVNLIRENKSFIINNTSLKKKYRTYFKSTCNNKNIVWNYIYVEAPTIEDNIKRRLNIVPASVIYKMQYDLDFPESDEYDKIIFIKQ